MDENRFRAMIAAYFLSREDERAYQALGYGTQLATHDAIGVVFSVKRNTVKNWRDEFDAIHDNSRQGWYQRPLRPSRARLAERYRDVSFDALLALVKRLIQGDHPSVEVEVPEAALAPDTSDGDDDDDESAPHDGARGVTGRAAEDAFVLYHASSGLPVAGTLVDCRTSGGGYDFQIIGAEGTNFVEVKGLAGSSGSVSLTSKEWQTAKEVGDRYFIALVLEVSDHPRVVCLRNPSALLTPKLRLLEVIQEQWCLQASAIVRLGS